MSTKQCFPFKITHTVLSVQMYIIHVAKGHMGSSPTQADLPTLPDFPGKLLSIPESRILVVNSRTGAVRRRCVPGREGVIPWLFEWIALGSFRQKVGGSILAVAASTAPVYAVYGVTCLRLLLEPERYVTMLTSGQLACRAIACAYNEKIQVCLTLPQRCIT